MTQPPYGEYPPPVDPFSTGQQPPYQGGYPPPAAPGYPPPAAPGYPPPAYPTSGYPATGYDPTPPPPPPPKKRRGLMITAIVFGVVLVLCAGGSIAAYFYLKDAGGGKGADTATAAVNDFLVAVYSDHDADKAEKLVCPAARKKSDLTRKIDEVKKYKEGYKEPKFTWPEPTVAEQKADSAKLTVKVKVTTDDEKYVEQPLRFTAVKKDGWFVCEVETGS